MGKDSDFCSGGREKKLVACRSRSAERKLFSQNKCWRKWSSRARARKVEQRQIITARVKEKNWLLGEGRKAPESRWKERGGKRLLKEQRTNHGTVGTDSGLAHESEREMRLHVNEGRECEGRERVTSQRKARVDQITYHRKRGRKEEDTGRRREVEGRYGISFLNRSKASLRLHERRGLKIGVSLQSS